jgi:hypothetical protein
LNFELGIREGVRANIKLLKYDAQKAILLLIIQQQLLILYFEVRKKSDSNMVLMSSIVPFQFVSLKFRNRFGFV